MLNREEGFTYFEVIIALLIVSIISYTLWGNLSSFFKAIESVREKNESLNQLVEFEYWFRKEINQSGPEFWKKDFDFQFNGIEDSGDNLHLETADGIFLFDSLQLIDLESDEESVKVIILYGNKDQVLIEERWGSFSL